MLKFKPVKYGKKDGTRFISYDEIDWLTEELLKDYRPENLKYPQTIRYDDFLINYLDADLRYEHIWPSDSGDKYLGVTVFKEGNLKVLNTETVESELIKVYPGDIILDYSVVNGDRKIQQITTGLHEGGHLWMHGEYYGIGQNQVELFSNGIVKCDATILNALKEKPKSLTDAQWRREWQATIFAVTLALPKRSLEIAVRDILAQYGIKDHLVYDEASNWNLAYNIIPEQLQDTYGVSKESIRYRLEKLKYYISKERYTATKSQMTIFDLV